MITSHRTTMMTDITKLAVATIKAASSNIMIEAVEGMWLYVGDEPQDYPGEAELVLDDVTTTLIVNHILRRTTIKLGAGDDHYDVPTVRTAIIDAVIAVEGAVEFEGALYT